METPFMEPGELNTTQLAFVTIIYAVVLYQASGLISEGSELLMLVPAVAALVGSVVLPILGAVPDGMMVLFSGVGPNAQETVAVGVGALAGSTVMLLTFPWFICIVFGKVPTKDGKPDWSSKEKAGMCGGAISYQNSIRKNCMIMLMTTILYMVIQVPASMEEAKGASTKAQGKAEHQPAYLGFICCCVAFVGYLIYCVFDASEDKQLAEVIKGIEQKQISIAAALEFVMKTSSGKDEALLQTEQMTRLKKICRPFFKRYDFDRNNSLCKSEVGNMIADLGYSRHHLNDLFSQQDTDGDNKVTFEEFTKYFYDFMQDPKRMAAAPKVSDRDLTVGDDEDEEEEVPEDLAHLSPRQQLLRVLFRSFWMMGLGTVLVLVFSDPMVDCLSEWGNRLGISAFYISFVLAPFASNASELLSAYTYARKKTEKNITTSLSTLVGAACMNNTFVLAIFLALIYLQGLAWQFTAETIAMVLIQWVIGLLTIVSKKQNMVHAILILLCYPGCLFIVWFLENVVGLD